jgi:hypothetical protein
MRVTKELLPKGVNHTSEVVSFAGTTIKRCVKHQTIHKEVPLKVSYRLNHLVLLQNSLVGGFE